MWFSALQLDAAAPVLANLKEPIVIAKVDADKHTRLARKYDVEYVFFGPIIDIVCLFEQSFFFLLPNLL
jgi:hypothetical protein